MNPFRLLSAILGIILAIAAVAAFVGGISLIVAHAIFRDDAGYVTSPAYTLASDNYAITMEGVDVASRPGDWLPAGLVDIRATVTAEGGKAVFFGIGPSDAVDDYLSGVGRDEVRRLGDRRVEVTYRRIDGDAPAMPPAEAGFWAISGSTSDFQSMTWEVEAGEWSLVIMNADASAGIAATASVGANIPFLFAIAAGLIVGGVILGALAVGLIAAGFGNRAGISPPAPAVGTARSSADQARPVVLEGHLDPDVSRWMWLVKWFLAIPHIVILAFLWAGFVLLTIVAFFSILFTGRYPRGLFDINVGIVRWTWRVGFYAFSTLGTDRYPPFSLADDPTYPARYDVAYPERLSQGLVLVKWWLLAIPHYIIVGVLVNGIVWSQSDFVGDRVLEIGGGLIGILAFVAGIVLLFTGRYPASLFDLLIGLNRWVYRVIPYAALMRDEYPPFRLDMGGSEPATAPEAAPGQAATT